MLIIISKEKNKMYDYIIVGAGFYGSVCARELTNAGYKCLVIDNRDHIGGNCYTENRDGINLHVYGPHIFHTSNKEVWNWINQYAEFNNFIYSPVANYKDEIYSLPFNMWTFNKLWNVSKPKEVEAIIKEQSKHISDPTNLEEQAIKLVGTEVYEKLIKGYTAKQWRKDPKQLPKEIIKRLPVRMTYDNNYFNDKYQGIPIGGYTGIFERLLKNIDLQLNQNFLENSTFYQTLGKKIIYTGPIDKYFNYEFGELEYKTTKFEHHKLDIRNYQGVATMNYTDINIPYTRIIEHKHFEDSNSDQTWVTKEYPIEYDAKTTEPMYPVNDNINNFKYQKYKELADNLPNIIFGGRLAEYKYYNMDEVIISALNKVKELTKI
jgi:UDP-galactopyranose mutase